MTDSSMEKPNEQPFLSLSDQGKNEWYRYLLSFFVILILWQILGAVPYAFVYILNLTDNLYLTYITQSFSFLCFLGAIYFAVRTIHRRPIMTVMTPGSKLNWKLVFSGAGLWLVLSILVTMGDVLFHPGTYRWAFDFRQ